MTEALGLHLSPPRREFFPSFFGFWWRRAQPEVILAVLNFGGHCYFVVSSLDGLGSNGRFAVAAHGVDLVRLRRHLHILVSRRFGGCRWKCRSLLIIRIIDEAQEYG